NRAIALKPNDADAHYNLGNSLSAALDFDEAITSYKRAIELKPGYAAVYTNLANVLIDCRRIDEAIEAVRTSIRIDPTRPKPWSNLLLFLHYDAACNPDAVFKEH